MKTKTAFALLILLTLHVATSTLYSCIALSPDKEALFNANQITFYDPDDCVEGFDENMDVSICGTTLPEETIRRIESAQVKEKAEQNMERYMYAQEQTQIPWQVVAALHYREGGMRPEASISNGQNLTADGSCYRNVDGVEICGNANEDAKAAAEHLITLTREVYPEVDLFDNPTAEDYGKAFLAYNRYNMYKCRNHTFDESPYVMNYYDNDHFAMKWLEEADTTGCNGKVYNHHGGRTDDNVGALAILAYLCGDNASLQDNAASSTTAPKSSPSSTKSSSANTSSYTLLEGYGNLTFYGPDAASNGGYAGRNGTESINGGALADGQVARDTRDGGILAFGDIVYIETTSEEGAESSYANGRYFIVADTGGETAHSAKWDIDVFVDEPNPSALNYPPYGSTTDAKVYKVASDVSWEEYLEKYADKTGDNCTSYEGDYPQYRQCDPQWAETDVTPGYSYCRAGCGVAALAMIATVASGQDVLPTDVARITSDCPFNFSCAAAGGRVENAKKVCKEYGCEAMEIESTEDAMRQALKDGWMLFYSGVGDDHEPFTGNGHYIGIFKIDNNDTVLIADPGLGNREMPFSKAISGRHYAITAIRGKKSGKNSCAKLCNDSESSAIGEAANIPLEERMNWLFPNGVPSSESEMQQYLTDVEVPIIDESGNNSTISLTVHKKLAEEIKAIFTDMTKVKNFRIKSDTYAYDWRQMASGTGHMSHHSYGVAIDINADDNPATYTGGEYNPGGNYFSVTDEIVKIWKDHGFYWGGDWSGYYKDYMHFTYTNH